MVVEESRQAQVKNLDNSATLQQDVARLNVAMDQARLVKML